MTSARRIFSFADFERAFGGLTPDSVVSRAVRDFFQNGGTDAYIVRVALGADVASVDLRPSTTAGAATLSIEASSEGTWGNNLRVEVDYDTLNPGSLFNVKVTELIERNGALIPGRTEVFRNLSMDSQHPNYVESVINGTSNLVTTTRLPIAFAGSGTSTSEVLSLAADFANPLPAGYRLAYTLNGQGPFEITVTNPTPPGATLASTLAAIVADVGPLMAIASPPGATVSAVSGNTQLRFTAVTDATHPAEQSSIHFVPASRDDASKQLKLGLLFGGVEVDAAAAYRPAANGTGGDGPLPATPSGQLTIDVRRGTTTLKAGITLDLWGPPTTVAQPTTFEELTAAINGALVAASATEPFLVGARASRVGGVLRILAVNDDPNIYLVATGATAGTLNLSAAGSPNLIQYAPGTGTTSRAQVAGSPGNNGTPPSPALLAGTMAAKTGLYALEDVDLFNLLVIPEATEGGGHDGRH